MFGDAAAEKIQDQSGLATCPSRGPLSRPRIARMRRLLIIAIAMTVSSPVARAQSLGDVARQEEARRKAVPQPARVYTDENLRRDGVQAVPGTSPAKASPAPDTASASQPESAKTAAAATGDETTKDEKYWRQRLENARTQLSRAETFAEALQSRINALTTDFAAHDDPFQRNQIGGERQKALSELDRVRKEIVTHSKAVADIREEGRRAGVPPAWLR